MEAENLTSGRRVLMVAYHFPPWEGSSGIHRTVSFCKYLPEYGWNPVVLTAHPRAYPRATKTIPDPVIPGLLEIARASALDSARHLSLFGRYPAWFARPDRWVSWWLGAVPAGLRLIRKYRPAVIWSTYPIATAHLIGLTLHRLTGIPWVADFRDSMTEENYPRDASTRRVYRWIERHAIQSSRAAVFTTTSALRMYRARYESEPESKFVTIANGYDEEAFLGATRAGGDKPADAPVTLVHSGLLYTTERDPRQFFGALSQLRKEGVLVAGRFKVVLRASGYEDFYRPILRELMIDDIVTLEPPIGYQAALTEMLAADGLLVFQAESCNHQIPAKIYEYLRARRPILALTDFKGDTAATLREAGILTIYPLDSMIQIKEGLRDFLAQIRDGRTQLPDVDSVTKFSRKSRTEELSALFDSIAGRCPGVLEDQG